MLIRNHIPGASQAVVLELVGRVANRDGLGAIVRARIGGRTLAREVGGDRGYLSHGDARVYLSLGAATRVDDVRFSRPGGGEETLTGMDSGISVVVEGVGPRPPGDRAMSAREQLSLNVKARVSCGASSLPTLQSEKDSFSGKV